MNVKNVVKVMNFHSLLRVDKARKEAEKYFQVEAELRKIINVVTNNRNFVLDKKELVINKDAPVLNIYVGSDLGFCAGYNTVVMDALRRDRDACKVVIGKKIHVRDADSSVVLNQTKEEYLDAPATVNEFLNAGIKEQRYSEINILYNHYVNAGEINWMKKRVFPLDVSELAEGSNDYKDDYVCETNVNELLMNLVISYIKTEIEVTVKNSLASENIMRQNATTESLKKIDELEDEKRRKNRKVRVAKSTAKITESFSRLKFQQGEQ